MSPAVVQRFIERISRERAARGHELTIQTPSVYALLGAVVDANAGLTHKPGATFAHHETDKND
jgi:hypothetical protein